MNLEKLEFFIQIVEFGVIASPVITLILQKLKKTIKMKASLFRIVSAILSIILGYGAAILFSDFNREYAIVCGIIICAGADAVYKALESRNILSSIKDKKKEVQVPIENEIKEK
jgi:hypothetical protein